MKLFCLPHKEFQKLISKSVSEEEGNDKNKRKFSSEEFKEFASSTLNSSNDQENYYKAVRWLTNKNAKYVGEGSSRTAFCIPPGSWKDGSAPICLKIAKNEKGIAQNKAEIEVFRKYGKFHCFPEIYEQDPNGFFTMMEMGEYDFPVQKIKIWFEKWNRELLKMEDRKTELDQDLIFDNPPITSWPARISRLLKLINNDDIDDSCFKIFNKMDNVDKKYEALTSLFKFVKVDRGRLVVYGDFAVSDNWAFVIRDGRWELIPIDWGFSPEVRRKYYK